MPARNLNKPLPPAQYVPPVGPTPEWDKWWHSMSEADRKTLLSEPTFQERLKKLNIDPKTITPKTKSFLDKIIEPFKDTPAKIEQVPKLPPNVISALDQLLEMGMKGVQGQKGFGQPQLQKLYEQVAQGLGKPSPYAPQAKELLQQSIERTKSPLKGAITPQNIQQVLGQALANQPGAGTQELLQRAMQTGQTPEVQQLLNRALQGGQTPEVQQLLGRAMQGGGLPETQGLLQQALAGSQTPRGYEFEPIAERARSQFTSRTVPTLAERFTAMGGASKPGSSAFAGTLGQAASDLESQLAALKSQYNIAERQQLSHEQQARQGLLGQLFGQGNTQQQLLQNLLGQQQTAGLQGQGLLQNLLGQQQATGLQERGLTQNLLGQQQAQALQGQGLKQNLLGQLLGYGQGQQQLGLQQQGLGQNLLSDLLTQGTRGQALQQGLFGNLLGAGQAQQAQGLQALFNMLQLGTQPRTETVVQPGLPGFGTNLGAGLGQIGGLGLAGLGSWLTGKLF